jgi:hypothetical protein
MRDGPAGGKQALAPGEMCSQTRWRTPSEEKPAAFNATKPADWKPHFRRSEHFCSVSAGMLPSLPRVVAGIGSDLARPVLYDFGVNS